MKKVNSVNDVPSIPGYSSTERGCYIQRKQIRKFEFVILTSTKQYNTLFFTLRVRRAESFTSSPAVSF